ncbi:MAG: metallophosphoesterase [Planctomycetota bacterium]|jgi:predicted phosphodiesterase
MPSLSSKLVLTRRKLLKASALAVAGTGISQLSCAVKPLWENERGLCRFGMVTDCHYADADSRNGRYYRESLEKLAECVELMNAEKVDFLIELGDFKDENKNPVEEKTLAYLQAIEHVFQQFKGPTYHVLGNHDMDSISKQQFLANVINTGIDPTKSYYSFDSKGFHFVVLDANYRKDGVDYDHNNFDWTSANVPQHELDWLVADLDSARGPVIVFIHQLLAGVATHRVKNAEEVRSALESSGKVAAVFQGHKHKGTYDQIEGIHYYASKAMVEGSGPENSAYAIVDIMPNGAITVTGYRRAESKRMDPPYLSSASS